MSPNQSVNCLPEVFFFFLLLNTTLNHVFVYKQRKVHGPLRMLEHLYQDSTKIATQIDEFDHLNDKFISKPN